MLNQYSCEVQNMEGDNPNNNYKYFITDVCEEKWA